VLRDYSKTVVDFAASVLSAYAGQWHLDYASFRPQEEASRKLSRHARNDLLHVDSFPTRPTRGDRIFRVFTNINPTAPRVWRTGETFRSSPRRLRDRVGTAGTRDPPRARPIGSLAPAVGRISGAGSPPTTSSCTGSTTS
jgi:hypothetical protein